MAAMQPPRVPHVHIDRKPVQLAIIFASKRKSGKTSSELVLNTKRNLSVRERAGKADANKTENCIS